MTRLDTGLLEMMEDKRNQLEEKQKDFVGASCIYFRTFVSSESVQFSSCGAQIVDVAFLRLIFGGYLNRSELISPVFIAGFYYAFLTLYTSINAFVLTMEFHHCNASMKLE